MLILATNRANDLDPAVLTRLDHKIFVDPPAFAERKKIFNQYAAQFFSRSEIAKFFNDAAVNKICQRIEGFTGRTIFKMLNALLGNKYASKNYMLTQQMIDELIQRFIEQEKVFLESNR